MRVLKITILMVVSMSLLAAAIGLLWLDYQVTSRFDGNRWAVPAKVFAAPVELYPRSPITAKALAETLLQLGYVVGDAKTPGSFKRRGSVIDVHVRGFRFSDEDQPPKKLRIRANDQGIQSIHSAGKAVPLWRLDPLLIGSIHKQQAEDRLLVSLQEVPDFFVSLLIAVEDRRFRSHAGVDLRGIARAIKANIQAGKTVQGGSTLTQQLVKNFYLNSERSLRRKLLEAIMAALLEVHYSKDEILEAYLNEIYLGQDGDRAIHGIGLASYFYFGKPVAELEAQEMATLVGMIKGPSLYSPRRNPERAKKRRNLVLDLSAEQGLLDAADVKQLSTRPVLTVKKKKGRIARYPAYTQLVRRQLAGEFPEDVLNSEGLRIFTSLDTPTQAVLDRTLDVELSKIEAAHSLETDSLEAAAIVIEANSSTVLALAGGRNARFAGFNRALDARRPIGSLIKPVLYLSALERGGYNLVSPLDDSAVEIQQRNGDIWAPKNYDDTEHGVVPLYQALTHSYNLATVKLSQELGIDAVLDTLMGLGFSQRPAALPSVALGAIDASPIEVAKIYMTFASGGYSARPNAIVAVNNAQQLSVSRYPIEVEQVIAPGPLYLLDWNLSNVMQEGTGRFAASRLPLPETLRGKTGTTNDQRDSWFVGYNGAYLIAVWVGRDDNAPTPLTGATGALRLWTALMKQLPARYTVPAGRPQSVGMHWIELDTMRLAKQDCNNVRQIPFVLGSEPQEWHPCAGFSAERIKSWLRPERVKSWLEKLFE